MRPLTLSANGLTAESVPLCKTVGEPKPVQASGYMDAETAEKLLRPIRTVAYKGQGFRWGWKQASVFPAYLKLLGTEELTVGCEGETGDRNRLLLVRELCFLKIWICRRLNREIFSFSRAAQVTGADGAPVRAILIKS
jgi:hypothetical protein